MSRIWTTLLLTILVPVLAGAAEGPVDKDGRPLIRKLGTVALDQVENSPVVFQGKLYLFVGRGMFHFVERDTGRTTPAFAGGYFGNAFVAGDTVYVTVAHAKEKIHMFTSKDLEHWESSVVLDLPGFTIYNTSICSADDKYVMMFEIGLPKEQAGVPFTARFATSNDLKQWTVTSPECVYTKERYSAPHCLRYLDGYYYNFYLEARPGRHYEMYVVRSQDLIHWESSPLNPVLRESPEDRKLHNLNFTRPEQERIATAVNCNNSDLDFCEYQGRVVLYYSWGNQLGIEHLADAVYDGTQAQFLRGWFPKKN
ncbi:MAG: hypothetical protein GXY83_36850 [Rhodopirellula sp.]|nr:hypothetical protein [Rhodopirellula sp.]